MTPQERQLIDDLFGRLSKVEGAQRDPEAENAIAQGQRQAPNALYALVQTVLVQDEALKRADARIQELENGGQVAHQPPGGFLDSMRDALFGGSQTPPAPSRSSVPPAGGRPVWNTGQVQGNTYGQPQGTYQGGQYGQPPMDPRQMGMGYQGGQPQQQGGGGGSFLGTAAATVAGVVGGSLLMNSMRGMMGGGEGHSKSAFGDTANASDSKSPWSSDSSTNNDLAKDAGINDIGSRHADQNSGNDQQYGAYDNASNDQDDVGGDNFDDNDGGDSDFA